MASLDDLKSAQVKLFSAQTEAGAWNSTKSTLLTDAQTLILSAITAAGSSGEIDTEATALAVQAASKIVFALEMGAGAHNGSAFPVLEQQIQADYMTVNEAYDLVVAAIALPLVS
jgi:hypothetical protein